MLNKSLILLGLLGMVSCSSVVTTSKEETSYHGCRFMFVVPSMDPETGVPGRQVKSYYIVTKAPMTKTEVRAVAQKTSDKLHEVLGLSEVRVECVAIDEQTAKSASEAQGLHQE